MAKLDAWCVLFAPKKGGMIDSGMYVMAQDYESALVAAYPAAREMFAKTYDGNHLDVVRSYNPAKVPEEGLSPYTAVYVFDPVSQEYEVARVYEDLSGPYARRHFESWCLAFPYQVVFYAQLTIREARKQGFMK